MRNFRKLLSDWKYLILIIAGLLLLVALTGIIVSNWPGSSEDDYSLENETVQDEKADNELVNEESSKELFKSKDFPIIEFEYDSRYWTSVEESSDLGWGPRNVTFLNSTGDELTFSINAFGAFGPYVNEYCSEEKLIFASSSTVNNIGVIERPFDDQYMFILNFYYPDSPEGLAIQEKAEVTVNPYTNTLGGYSVDNPTYCKGIDSVYLMSNITTADFPDGAPAGFIVITDKLNKDEYFYTESFKLLDSMVESMYNNYSNGDKSIQLFL